VKGEKGMKKRRGDSTTLIALVVVAIMVVATGLGYLSRPLKPKTTTTTASFGTSGGSSTGTIVPLLIGTVCLAVVGYLVFRKYQKYVDTEKTVSSGEWGRLGAMIFTIIIIGILILTSFTTVQVGHAKLVVNPLSGSISGPHLGEKWFFRFPWTRVVDIYYATQSTEMWTDNELPVDHPQRKGEYSAVKVLSNDGLDIEVDILIRYEIDPTSLIALYRKYPDLQYERKAISSITREDVRDVISNYLTLEVIEKREALSVEMTQKILFSLSNEPSLVNALKNIQIDLRDIDPPASFKLAVANKKTAEQQKLQAEHERETKLIQADATAKEAIRLAEGEAESTVIRANATREALNLITQEIDPEVYYSLQMLKEVSPNVKFLILTMGEDGVPIYYQVPSDEP
jgi:regulator of protease activity HflC (stomatin/prohibitin superfamily)